MLACGGCLFFGSRVVGAPIDATNDYMQNLQDGNYQAAHDSLCDETSLTVEELTAQTQADFPDGIDSYKFGLGEGLEIVNDVATASGTVTTGGVEKPVNVDLKSEDGLNWKVCP